MFLFVKEEHKFYAHAAAHDEDDDEFNNVETLYFFVNFY